MAASIFGAADRAYALTPTAVQTANVTAVANQFIPVDTTSAALTVTLPTAPPDRTVVAVRIVAQAFAHTATVQCGGTDVLDKSAGPTSRVLQLLLEARWFQYAAATGIWHECASDLPLSGLDLRYGQLYNVVVYGADPSGTVDSYAAIQAAINAAQAAGPGQTVFFPPGTFLTSGIPTITGNSLVVMGSGWASTIKLGSAALNANGTVIGLWVNGANNVLIQDLAVDGNFANIAKDGGQVVASTLLGSSALGAAVTTAPTAGTTETWTVNSAAATATAGYVGVPFVCQVGSEIVVVTGGQGTTSWTVRRGFENTTPATHANGTSIVNTNGTTFDATITRYGISSPKCYMSSFYSGGNVGTQIDASTYLHQRMPIRITNASGVTVKNCLIQNSVSAGILVDSTAVNGTTDVLVTNNRIKLTWDNGVYFHQGDQYCTAAVNEISDTMYNGVSVVYGDHVNVVGNNIRQAGPSFSDSGGVQINGSSNCAVTGNLIDACQFEGVNVLSSQETNITGGQSGNQVWSSNTTVAGNTITNCQANDFSTHISNGVNVFGGTNTKIIGNAINACDYGISLGSKATRTRALDCDITNSRSLGINIGNSPDVIDTVIKNCFVGYGQSHGIYVNAPASIENCKIIGNGSGGNGMGVNLSNPPSGIPRKTDYVRGCTIRNNLDSGVYANQGAGNIAVVEGCDFGNDPWSLFTDGSITFNSTTFNSPAQAQFAASDVGLPIVLLNQGSGGVTTATTISGFTSATQVTLASAAQATETGVSFWVGRGASMATDGSTTNAASSVLTSTSQMQFTSQDVGELVILLSQTATPSVLFVGTISAFTSATQVTLSGPAGAISACTILLNRSRAQQVRGINWASGQLIERGTSMWGIPQVLTGAGTFNVEARDRWEVYDAAVTLDRTARYVAYVALTAARTATLPDATVYPVSETLTLKDEAGTAGTNNITAATQGGQTIDGAATKVINTNNGLLRLRTSGAQWFTV